MKNLDDLTGIRNLDKVNAYDSISLLADQCRQAWQETGRIDFSSDYYDIDNVVVSGMGGSTYGARIVKSLYDGAQQRKIPIELANGYWLPGYVNEKTLVVLSSYSGSTEETYETALQAKKKKAKIAGVTSGGKLAQFLKENNYPSYIFSPKYNPCGQPRIGVGYMVMGLIGMLAKLKIIQVGNEEILQLIKFLQDQKSHIAEQAKDFSIKLRNKIPIFIVADFLEGAGYAVRNPVHETAKQFSLYFTIPELNHHLMEGLSYPEYLKKNYVFVFIQSNIYDKRNIKRMELTKEIVNKNQFDSIDMQLHGLSGFTQTMEFIQWGAWLSFYLAMLNNVNPSEIPWVDYFKKKLQNFFQSS